MTEQRPPVELTGVERDRPGSQRPVTDQGIEQSDGTTSMTIEDGPKSTELEPKHLTMLERWLRDRAEKIDPIKFRTAWARVSEALNTLNGTEKLKANLEAVFGSNVREQLIIGCLMMVLSEQVNDQDTEGHEGELLDSMIIHLEDRAAVDPIYFPKTSQSQRGLMAAGGFVNMRDRLSGEVVPIADYEK